MSSLQLLTYGLYRQDVSSFTVTLIIILLHWKVPPPNVDLTDIDLLDVILDIGYDDPDNASTDLDKVYRFST